MKDASASVKVADNKQLVGRFPSKQQHDVLSQWSFCGSVRLCVCHLCLSVSGLFRRVHVCLQQLSILPCSSHNVSSQFRPNERKHARQHYLGRTEGSCALTSGRQCWRHAENNRPPSTCARVTLGGKVKSKPTHVRPERRRQHLLTGATGSR